MEKADRYLSAGTRENTRKSYRATIEHFEVTWGGYLPTTGVSVVRYLAEYATLKQRLAALGQRHITQGFRIRQMLLALAKCLRIFKSSIQLRSNGPPLLCSSTLSKQLHGWKEGAQLQ